MLRREEIKLQVALITPLVHVKGYAAREVKAAVDRARLLIEQAETLGEPPDDPLLAFSILYGFWVVNQEALKGDAVREIAAQFLALAQKQGATVPVMIGHRLMATSLLITGDPVASREHFERAIALYDPAQHRPLATRFGQDVRVSALAYRSIGRWMLGYPEAALADADHALQEAREIGQAATLMFTFNRAGITHIVCRNYETVIAQCDERITLAEQKGTLLWKANGILHKGCAFALIGRALEGIEMLTAGISAYRSTGATIYMPLYLLCLATAYAEAAQLDDAWARICESMEYVETNKERLWEAEANRVAGELVLQSPQRNAAKAEGYFESALAIARAQQAKSWELRAAKSMARLWRDQGKRDEARDLLAPVYGWFTEGFDTLDLKEAKALLDELTSAVPVSC